MRFGVRGKCRVFGWVRVLDLELRVPVKVRVQWRVRLVW